MKAGVDVTIRYAGLALVVGNNASNGELTPGEAKRLAPVAGTGGERG